MNIKNIKRYNNDENKGIITKVRKSLKKPNMFAVLLINDDYTPMEFVIYILQSIFRKS